MGAKRKLFQNLKLPPHQAKKKNFFLLQEFVLKKILGPQFGKKKKKKKKKPGLRQGKQRPKGRLWML